MDIYDTVLKSNSYETQVSLSESLCCKYMYNESIHWWSLPCYRKVWWGRYQGSWNHPWQSLIPGLTDLRTSQTFRIRAMVEFSGSSVDVIDGMVWIFCSQPCTLCLAIDIEVYGFIPCHSFVSAYLAKDSTGDSTPLVVPGISWMSSL